MNRKATTAVGLLALAYVTWAAVRHLSDPEAGSLIGLVDFGVHEFGHLAFALFGEWLAVAGGTLASLLIPVLLALLFRKQREPIGIAVCGAWLAVALARIAVYMADARVLELDLVSFAEGGDGHDWHYLFTSLGVIEWDTKIAGVVRLLGWLLIPASVVYGLSAAQAALARNDGGRPATPSAPGSRRP